MKPAAARFHLRPGVAVVCLLLSAGAGCHAVRPDARPLRLAPPDPQGWIVHSDLELGYAIIAFDVWPEVGAELLLADGDGITARIEVTDRHRGSYFVVNILDGQPRKGDYVAVDRWKECEHADE